MRVACYSTTCGRGVNTLVWIVRTVHIVLTLAAGVPLLEVVLSRRW
jgi:hypothetical protein